MSAAAADVAADAVVISGGAASVGGALVAGAIGSDVGCAGAWLDGAQPGIDNESVSATKADVLIEARY